MGFINQIENLAQLAYENSELGLWAWRPKTGEFDFDKKWCQMTGVDYESAPRLVKTWKDQVHPEDLALVLEKANVMLSQGKENWENIHRLRQPNGKWRWVLSRIKVAEYFEDKSAALVIGTHTDISVFKEQETFTEELQTIGQIGGWFLDLKTQKLTWTSGTYAIHQLCSETPLETNRLIDFYIPEDRERIQRAFEDCVNGKSFRGRFQLLDSKQVQKWVEVTGRPDIDANGAICGVSGTIQDVSTLARQELEIRAQKDRLETLMQNTPGMVYQFVLEPNGKMYFSYVSQKAFDIYELQPQDFKANPSVMLEMADVDDRDGLRLAIAESAKTMQPFNWRGRIHTGTGKTKWIHARSVPFHEPNDIIRWDGVVIDVTREEEMAQKIKQEQVLMVQQSKLISLGEMAAGVAHEINNPLAIVTGKIQTIGAIRHDDVQFARSLEICLKSLNRISKIIKSLQKFSRSGQLTDRANHSIRQIIDDVILLTQPKALRAQIEISTQIDADIVFKCNLVELEQVFINLINNGIDAAQEGQQNPNWVKIHTFHRGADFILQIIDSGPGISPAIRERMYEPFMTTKPVGLGTGLGLSIVKGILDQHSVTIQINEQVPWTCFELNFQTASVNN